LTSRGRASKRIISLVFSLVLILAASLLFGQVMGNLYLENIAAQGDGPSSIPDSPKTEKTKVLRLKELTYYTVEAAVYPEREAALSLGSILAAKGLPVVIGGSNPSRVRLGFINNEGKLVPLAQTIGVDGKKGKVSRGQIISVSFKFAGSDSYSSQKVAPFLGELSICLEKALLVNSDIDCAAEQLKILKPKFAELAGDVESLSAKCLEIANQNKESPHAPYLANLAAVLYNWGQSLNKLTANWDSANLLVSQQQALVVVEEYQSFLNSTN